MDKIGLILRMHFQDKLFRCENCEDFKIGVCPGEGLTGYSAVRRCMEGKHVEFASSSGSVGFDQ